MEELIENDRLNELVRLIQEDPRLENVAVDCQPALLRLHIGGQTPFWEYQVDKSRLESGTLSVYAREIVDEWAEATGRA